MSAKPNVQQSLLVQCKDALSKRTCQSPFVGMSAPMPRQLGSAGWTHDAANPQWVPNEHGTLNSVLSLTKTIVFHLEGYTTAKKVFLSGSFNDWATNREPMARTDTGWSIAVELTPGKHYYKFIVDGQWITDPHNPLSEYDGSGNLNSILLVQ